MSFRVLYPGISVPLMVDADNFTNAAKQFIKLNQHLNITEMMIRDQANNQMFANINYMNDNKGRRASINMKRNHRYTPNNSYNPYMGGPIMGPVIIGGIPATPAATPAAGTASAPAAGTAATPAAAPAAASPFTGIRVVDPVTKQLLPVNFGMVPGVQVPFGLGAYPGGPGVVVGGPMGIGMGVPVDFGAGLGPLRGRY